MNYEDELERARARRSRKRQNQDSSYRNDESTSYRSSREEPAYGSTVYRSGGDSSSHRPRGQERASSRETEKWSSSAEPGSRASRMNGTGGGRGPSGNRKRKKPMPKKKKIIIGVIVGMMLLVAVPVLAVLGYIRYNFGKLNSGIDFNTHEVQNLEIPQEARERMEKGFWTVAVFGVDSRDNSLGSGNQSDVIMIVNLNRETGEIQMVSVFRDTYLNINDKNTYNKINAAYAQGGPEQAVKALNKNLDLNITHYATFNWKAVATAINILGGIDVDISKTEFYYINAFITDTVKGTGLGSVQLKKAGVNHLDGVQAVAYARLRLMDNDYARTERQRLVVEKAFEKAKKADLATLNSLVGNMFAMTKSNIDELDILRMAKDVSKYHFGETSGFPAARDEKKIKIGSRYSDCVIPQTLESNVVSLHKFLYGVEDYTPTSTVKTISKKVSDISGLYKAGKEVGHVDTDKGYIPKSTTAAAVTTTAEENESDQSSEGESSSGESTVETSEGESGSMVPGESSSGATGGVNAGGWESMPTDNSGYPIVPTQPSYPYPTEQTTSEADRPKSPADMATMQTTEGFGPGSETTAGRIPEATTAPGSGPASGATQPSSNSSVIVSPTTEAPTSPAPYTAPTTAPATAPTTAPVSPAATPTTGAPLSPGDNSGPAGLGM